MPNISSVELTNTFDDWRNRTNDSITIINGANSASPTSALVYANSLGGFQVSEVTSATVTGTLLTGTRLVMTGGNVNFTSANTQSLGNVHQVHVLGGTSIDVSTPATADSSIGNTFIYNSKINLNGQKFISGAATIDLEGATVTNLGAVAKFTATALSDEDVLITNPSIVMNSGSGVGGLTISSGTHAFTGSVITAGTFDGALHANGTVEKSNVVVNGASFLVSTNSVALAVDVGTSNVAIGKFTEISTSIGTQKRPTSSKGRLHVRTELATGSSGSATAVEAGADELVLENENYVGMTFLSDNASNAHIAFGDPDDTDAGGILYNHATDDLHIVNEGANTAIFQNNFGGALQIAGGDTLGTTAGKLHVNVGSSDGTTGLYIDSNDVGNHALKIDGKQTTSHVMYADTDSLTTGSILQMRDTSASSGPRNVLRVNQTHTDAGGVGASIETVGMMGLQVLQQKTDNTSTNTVFIKSTSGTSTQKTLEVANSSGSMMTVVAGGGVGINDNTPSFKLDVNGDARIVNDLGCNSDIILAGSIKHEDDLDTKIDFTSDNIDFTTGNDLQLRLDSSTTYLYHDGSEKLKSISSGVDVTGQLQADRVYPCYDNSTSIYFDYPTGSHGSVQINGEGAGNWEGYSIDGRAVFMHDGGTQTGIYDDVNDKWILAAVHGGTTQLHHNGTAKIETTSTGISVSGGVMADSVQCRLRVLDQNGSVLNTS